MWDRDKLDAALSNPKKTAQEHVQPDMLIVPAFMWKTLKATLTKDGVEWHEGSSPARLYGKQDW